jgi:hypothetical protein
MDEGGLPIQATRQEHKGEPTSHRIWRMVMNYRLFHFDAPLQDRNTICTYFIATSV